MTPYELIAQIWQIIQVCLMGIERIGICSIMDEIRNDPLIILPGRRPPPSVLPLLKPNEAAFLPISSFGYRRKQSGNLPVGRELSRGSVLEMMNPDLGNMLGSKAIVTSALSPWVKKDQILGAFMICMGM